jgi:hypothetical protein
MICSSVQHLIIVSCDASNSHVQERPILGLAMGRASTGGSASAWIVVRFRAVRHFDPCHLDNNDAKAVIRRLGLSGPHQEKSCGVNLIGVLHTPMPEAGRLRWPEHCGSIPSAWRYFLSLSPEASTAATCLLLHVLPSSDTCCMCMLCCMSSAVQHVATPPVSRARAMPACAT